MFFSVCIPVYNTSRYLRECIESVLHQTERDYEIVLVDDGSTDNSGAICDEYAKRYPFVKVYHKENEGLLLTRRYGFRVAEGDYLICLDSDDYLYSRDALYILKNTITKESCDLLFFDYIYGMGAGESDRQIDILDKTKTFSGEGKYRIYQKILLGKFFNPIVIKVFSKKILDRETDYYQINRTMTNSQGEDLLQSLPIIDAAQKIVYLKQTLYYYRWNGGSISKNVRMDYYYSYRTIYGIEDQYIDKWKMSEEEIAEIKCRRMQTIIGLVGGGYHNSRYTKGEWSRFVTELSQDDFFRKLYFHMDRTRMILFNRVFAWLIVTNRPKMLGTILCTVNWIIQLRGKVIEK